MPDRRRHRGPHPEDPAIFDVGCIPGLRTAMADLSWLLSRGYADESSLKLVGDRYGLRGRQRMAVWRSACSDAARAGRLERRVTPAQLVGRNVAIDGYNVLITIESALSGGLILVGRDGAHRDLASVYGTYRKVEETERAITMLASFLHQCHVSGVDCYLDQPVSNSGRLKVFMAEVLEHLGIPWNIELVMSPDKVLADQDAVAATSDGWVLDHAGAWCDVAGAIINSRLEDVWLVNLR